MGNLMWSLIVGIVGVPHRRRRPAGDEAVREESTAVVSHPFARRKAKGWGTEFVSFSKRELRA
jgi:hypothetical protein